MCRTVLVLHAQNMRFQRFCRSNVYNAAIALFLLPRLTPIIRLTLYTLQCTRLRLGRSRRETAAAQALDANPDSRHVNSALNFLGLLSLSSSPPYPSLHPTSRPPIRLESCLLNRPGLHLLQRLKHPSATSCLCAAERQKVRSETPMEMYHRPRRTGYHMLP